MYAVRWAGRYVERHDDPEAARKFARLILGTVGDWTPECRRLHHRIVVLNEETRATIEELSVAEEMKRLELLAKEARPKSDQKRRSREHA